MTAPPRAGDGAATRTCPHCRETILESSAVCPSCRHHLRFGGPAQAITAAPGTITPLKVEGSIRNPNGGNWEYSMVLIIRNERGEEIGRHVAGVGAVFPGESRSFEVSVEAVPAAPGKRRLKH